MPPTTYIGALGTGLPVDTPEQIRQRILQSGLKRQFNNRLTGQPNNLPQASDQTNPAQAETPRPGAQQLSNTPALLPTPNINGMAITPPSAPQLQRPDTIPLMTDGKPALPLNVRPSYDTSRLRTLIDQMGTPAADPTQAGRDALAKRGFGAKLGGLFEGIATGLAQGGIGGMIQGGIGGYRGLPQYQQAVAQAQQQNALQSERLKAQIAAEMGLGKLEVDERGQDVDGNKVYGDLYKTNTGAVTDYNTNLGKIYDASMKGYGDQLAAQTAANKLPAENLTAYTGLFNANKGLADTLTNSNIAIPRPTANILSLPANTMINKASPQGTPQFTWGVDDQGNAVAYDTHKAPPPNVKGPYEKDTGTDKYNRDQIDADASKAADERFRAEHAKEIDPNGYMSVPDPKYPPESGLMTKIPYTKHPNYGAYYNQEKSRIIQDQDQAKKPARTGSATATAKPSNIPPGTQELIQKIKALPADDPRRKHPDVMRLLQQYGG